MKPVFCSADETAKDAMLTYLTAVLSSVLRCSGEGKVLYECFSHSAAQFKWFMKRSGRTSCTASLDDEGLRAKVFEWVLKGKKVNQMDVS